MNAAGWQVLSLLGALLCLAAYVMLIPQRATHRRRVLIYLMNLAGSGTLIVVAAYRADAGFIVLNAAWALISLQALYREIE